MLLTYFSDGLRNIMIHQYMGKDLKVALFLLGPVAAFTAIGVLTTKLREGQEAQRRLVDEISTFIVIIQ